MRGLADTIFRANPAYELVLLDRLAPAERERVGELEGAAEIYGILRPHRNSGLEPRSASRDTALLLFTLREPGPLPAYVRAELGDGLGLHFAHGQVDGSTQRAEHRRPPRRRGVEAGPGEAVSRRKAHGAVRRRSRA